MTLTNYVRHWLENHEADYDDADDCFYALCREVEASSFFRVRTADIREAYNAVTAGKDQQP